ncbi:MAG: helix-turn-helix domain-containing protein [Micromonosporaceae bacterium]
MEDEIERAVQRVIENMKQNLSEPLTIDDMARTAMFSKFHFSRIFRRVTGLSPGRFLSAMRLQKAKELLLATSLNVVDISYQVGYNSVGTFSSRFTRSVGLSPTAYRQVRGISPEAFTEPRPEDSKPAASVQGVIRAPQTDHRVGRVLVGLFPDRFATAQPVRCVVLNGPGQFVMDDVPRGTWHLIAVCVAIPASAPDTKTLHVLRHGPIEIQSDSAVALPGLQLRSSRSLDPPVLVPMPDDSDAA